MGSQDKNQEEDGGVQTLTRPKITTKRPSMYRVILLNDDFTPMDFVVHVLKKFFHKNDADAHEVMLAVHNKGQGVAGVYPFNVAETKVYLVNEYSRHQQHPLQCTMDQAPEEVP